MSVRQPALRHRGLALQLQAYPTWWTGSCHLLDLSCTTELVALAGAKAASMSAIRRSNSDASRHWRIAARIVASPQAWGRVMVPIHGLPRHPNRSTSGLACASGGGAVSTEDVNYRNLSEGQGSPIRDVFKRHVPIAALVT